jgi:hypothetical protein
MPKTIEITMTPQGFDVTTGGRTSSFRDLQQAVDYARTRLARAEEIRELSTRIG